jgi:hypothetical protein
MNAHAFAMALIICLREEFEIAITMLTTPYTAKQPSGAESARAVGLQGVHDNTNKTAHDLLVPAPTSYP